MHKPQRIKSRKGEKRETHDDGLDAHRKYIELSKPIDKRRLPWFYRLVLKFPGVNMIENASGAFWAIAIPILVFLNVLLSLYLLFRFSFPLNIILVAIIPVSLLIVFVKLSLERFINFWNLLVTKSGLEWNVKKTTKEYVDLLKRQKKNNRQLSKD